MPEPVKEGATGGADSQVTQSSSGTPAGQEGSSGERPIENLRGELLRKYDKLGEQVTQITQAVKMLTDRFGAPQQQQQAQLTNQYVPSQTAQQFQPGPVSQFGAPRPLSGYTDEQLQGHAQSAVLSQYQKEVIRQELEDRRQERRIDQHIQQREQVQRVNSLKQQSESAAMASFPALRDPSSEFSRKVEAELQQQRQMYGEFPTDKFDVANRIALSMGVGITRATVPGYTAPADGGSDRVERREAEEAILSDDEIDQLAKKFAHALPIDVKPDGRSVRRKFDKTKVKELSRGYGQVQHAYRSRGIKVSN